MRNDLIYQLLFKTDNFIERKRRKLGLPPVPRYTKRPITTKLTKTRRPKKQLKKNEPEIDPEKRDALNGGRRWTLNLY